jgi:hypothetical protein
MEIPKPSEADKEFFRSLIPEDPAVEIKPMFGNLGAFVHGNMFAGLFGPAVGVRLDEAASKELAAIDGFGSVRPGGAADGRLHQPARSLAHLARPGRGLGGTGPVPRQHAASQGQEAKARQLTRDQHRRDSRLDPCPKRLSPGAAQPPAGSPAGGRPK